MPTPISNPTRQKTVPTNGSSAETPIPLQQESDIIGPILLVTLLLTNGARHPYKIDEKYLKKRSVHVEDNNPVNMSTYTLKELIWRDWREGMAEEDTQILGWLGADVWMCRMGSSSVEPQFHPFNLLWKALG